MFLTLFCAIHFLKPPNKIQKDGGTKTTQNGATDEPP